VGNSGEDIVLGSFDFARCASLRMTHLCVEQRESKGNSSSGASQYLGEVFGASAGVLGDLFRAAEAVADDDGFFVVADGGE